MRPKKRKFKYKVQFVESSYMRYLNIQFEQGDVEILDENPGVLSLIAPSFSLSLISSSKDARGRR